MTVGTKTNDFPNKKRTFSMPRHQEPDATGLTTTNSRNKPNENKLTHITMSFFDRPRFAQLSGKSHTKVWAICMDKPGEDMDYYIHIFSDKPESISLYDELKNYPTSQIAKFFFRIVRALTINPTESVEEIQKNTERFGPFGKALLNKGIVFKDLEYMKWGTFAKLDFFINNKIDTCECVYCHGHQ